MEKNKVAETEILEMQHSRELNSDDLSEVAGGYLYENELKYPVGTVVDFRYNEPGRKHYTKERGVIQAIIRTANTSYQYLINGESIGLIAIDEYAIVEVY